MAYSEREKWMLQKTKDYNVMKIILLNHQILYPPFWTHALSVENIFENLATKSLQGIFHVNFF